MKLKFRCPYFLYRWFVNASGLIWRFLQRLRTICQYWNNPEWWREGQVQSHFFTKACQGSLPWCLVGYILHFAESWRCSCTTLKIFRDTVAAVSVHSSPPPLVVGDYEHVCFIRHALALDETRAPFLHLPISDRPLDPCPSGSSQLKPQEIHIKEVWFAGTHSEVYVWSHTFSVFSDR